MTVTVVIAIALQIVLPEYLVLQSRWLLPVVSLVTLALVIARAVNILK